jgi:hypothetical protein
MMQLSDTGYRITDGHLLPGREELLKKHYPGKNYSGKNRLQKNCPVKNCFRQKLTREELHLKRIVKVELSEKTRKTMIVPAFVFTKCFNISK